VAGAARHPVRAACDDWRLTESWTIIADTRRFTRLRGDGTMDEMLDTGAKPAILRGTQHGAVHP
jgi:hypothetical protein